MFATIRAVAISSSVVAALLSNGSVQAQTTNPQLEELCDGRGHVPDDVQISACTEIINSGRYGASRLNTAYFFRGLTYAQTFRCRLAIADFTAAIRYDSNDSDAYWVRHSCKEELGDIAGAEADKKAAKAIDPKIEQQWER